MKRHIPLIDDAMVRIPQKVLTDQDRAKFYDDLIFRVYDPIQSVENQIHTHEEDEEYFSVPRYYSCRITDSELWPRSNERVIGAKVSYRFTGQLKAEAKRNQVEAVRALSAAEGGILAAATGKGKTIMALASLAKVGHRALIIVPTDFLLGQWVEAIQQFTDLTPEKIGIVRGPDCQWNRPILVGTIQSLSQEKDYPPQLYATVGVVISDEVHRLGAPTWIQAIKKFPAMRRWGLSATVERPDGMHRAFKLHMGPIVYQMLELTIKPIVYVVHTGIFYDTKRYTFRGKTNFGRLYTLLSLDKVRNKMIAQELAKAYRSGRKAIALSERLLQMEIVAAMLEAEGVPRSQIGVINSKVKAAVRSQLLKESKVILAVKSIAGMGLDQPDLDTLCWLTPSQQVDQNIGRIVRENDQITKPRLLIDLVDEIPALRSMAKKRVQRYEEQGFEVHKIRLS
jgi:superfamily II DNA or RNA helicase